jgi:hypothetical protein
VALASAETTITLNASFGLCRLPPPPPVFKEASSSVHPFPFSTSDEEQSRRLDHLIVTYGHRLLLLKQPVNVEREREEEEATHLAEAVIKISGTETDRRARAAGTIDSKKVENDVMSGQRKRTFDCCCCNTTFRLPMSLHAADKDSVGLNFRLRTHVFAAGARTSLNFTPR